jgi:hypothetical protein
MGNVYRPVEQRARLTEEYAEAKMLFEERRLAQIRIAEIDRALREISGTEPEAVQVACWDVPFRRSPGRQKPVEKPAAASRSGALSLSSTAELSEL